jgi:Flp pilus assembly protein TadD
MGRRSSWILAAVLAACVAGAGSEVRRAEQEMATGQVDDAVSRLEASRTAAPGDARVRNVLGTAYYRRAREALDEGRFDDYEQDLERALDEWIASLRIDPTSPTPHTWMGIVAAYQGDLERSLRSFRNALRLEPRSWVAYTNLAQVLIYRGNLAQARHWLNKGERFGPHPAIVDLNLALAAWRQGDLIEARDLFDSAYYLDPDEVNTWDEAPVSEPIETFEDFSSYCCSNPACGPYMEVPCRMLQLAVRRRELRDETLRRELVIEMERRRRLNEIYRNRKDLKIEVEPVEPAGESH